MAEPRNQAGQQRHPQRKLSRRIFMAGMAVTGALVTGGGGLLWWEFIPHPLYTSQRHPGAVYTVAWSPGKRPTVHF
jgi:hypothetical protein